MQQSGGAAAGQLNGSLHVPLAAASTDALLVIRCCGSFPLPNLFPLSSCPAYRSATATATAALFCTCVDLGHRVLRGRTTQ